MKIPLPPGFVQTVVDGAPGTFYVREEEKDRLPDLLSCNPSVFGPRGPAKRGSVQELAGPDQGGVVVRRYSHGGLLGGLLGEFHLGCARAWEEVRTSELARQNGVMTPEVVAVRTEKCFGPFYRLDLLTRKIDGAQTLDAWLRSGPTHSDCRDQLGRAARFCRQMHDAGLFHADLHIRNLLVNPSGEIVVIDLDRSRFLDRIEPEMAARNLFRLNRSVEKFGVPREAVSGPGRLGFLHAYLSGPQERENLLKPWMRQCERHLRRHRLWWRLTRHRP